MLESVANCRVSMTHSTSRRTAGFSPFYLNLEREGGRERIGCR